VRTLTWTARGASAPGVAQNSKFFVYSTVTRQSLYW
jgi:hypothetical protein